MRGDVVEKLGMAVLWVMIVLLLREAILAGWIDKLIQ
jgi:hypothetical protein